MVYVVSRVASETSSCCRRFEEAEKLLEAALPAAEAISGDDHPRVALVLQVLAGVFARTRRVSFAEGLYKCASLALLYLARASANHRRPQRRPQVDLDASRR